MGFLPVAFSVAMLMSLGSVSGMSTVPSIGPIAGIYTGCSMGQAVCRLLKCSTGAQLSAGYGRQMLKQNRYLRNIVSQRKILIHKAGWD